MSSGPWWSRLDHPGVKNIWADQGSAGQPLVDWTAQILARNYETFSAHLMNAITSGSDSDAM
ncbi:hypothetical protein [Streptomyces sp. NRRL WC-3742]|uniref:hypothetical protein n=1 Tax=Streptomyces sp. NRRL WC-3742 TaxID=1463934 RepID=UPI0004CA082D|nr:hypothetical protein [Streptomyces sp. NRRL WC-3742]